MKRFKQFIKEGKEDSREILSESKFRETSFTPSGMSQLFHTLDMYLEHQHPPMSLNEAVQFMVNRTPNEREYLRNQIENWRGDEDSNTYQTLKEVFDII